VTTVLEQTSGGASSSPRPPAVPRDGPPSTSFERAGSSVSGAAIARRRQSSLFLNFDTPILGSRTPPSGGQPPLHNFGDARHRGFRQTLEGQRRFIGRTGEVVVSEAQEHAGALA
jgi:hypothetical protein